MSQPSQMFEPRLCQVSKRMDFDGYGFNLHAEKGRPGQFIGKVDENSPAESSGLRQGDRIIEVNGVKIGSETHKQVVERIKSVPDHTILLVIDPKADIQSYQQRALIEKLKKNAEEVLYIADTNGKDEESSKKSHQDSKEMETNGNITVSIDSTDSSTSTASTLLHLPMTVAEMRAQLKSKKRADPKSEGIDARKKYDMIQKM